MVTGVYFPEINGAVLQCMQLIGNLKNLVSFSILTGSNIKKFDSHEYVDGVLVSRVVLDRRKKVNYIVNLVRFFFCLIGMLKKCDLVHLHGFSKRNAIVIAVSKIFKKDVILKMTSYGHDDPVSVKNSFFLSWFLFKRCRSYIGISPAFSASYREAGLSIDKYNFIPNCVDSNRFSPASKDEKNKLKFKYGFNAADRIILFVGHFSHEKRPMLAYKTWLLLNEGNADVKIIFIGHTMQRFEVDHKIVEVMKRDALQKGVLSSIHFIEKTENIDEYMKFADVFILSSTREGLPNVLLEAMASAIPCIVSNLPGVTDWLIDDGVTGVLVSSDNHGNWADKISPFLQGAYINDLMGLKARSFVQSNFSIDLITQSVVELYKKSL